MNLDRRSVVAAGALGGMTALAAGAANAAGPRPQAATTEAASAGRPASDLGIEINTDRDQTARLQAAIDRLSPTGTPLVLPPGRIRTTQLTLRPGTQITGVPGQTRLELTAGGPILTGSGTPGVRLDGLVLDGRNIALPGAGLGGLLDLMDAAGLMLRSLAVTRSPHSGITLTRAGGHVTDCTLSELGAAAIHSVDAIGLTISHNTVLRIRNNGILVWRSKPGEDGTIVANNRIAQIASAAGGTGQNGNGINVYRAASVLVTGNRITDCAYTAVRANSSSNVQMIANSCERLGEVALYAEFAFEGAVISSNLVDHAATGISVTNFNEGGRLAVIQGNLVRNLVRREAEPADKRGEGIAVEADAVISGNVVEQAATCGLLIGWGRYMRDVVASQNLIRRTRIGIAISGDKAAGSALITGNMISGATEGAIRSMRDWTPVGPDLATAKPDGGRVQVSGNMVA